MAGVAARPRRTSGFRRAPPRADPLERVACPLASSQRLAGSRGHVGMRTKREAMEPAHREQARPLRQRTPSTDVSSRTVARPQRIRPADPRPATDGGQSRGRRRTRGGARPLAAEEGPRAGRRRGATTQAAKRPRRPGACRSSSWERSDRATARVSCGRGRAPVRRRHRLDPGEVRGTERRRAREALSRRSSSPAPSVPRAGVGRPTTFAWQVDLLAVGPQTLAFETATGKLEVVFVAALDAAGLKERLDVVPTLVDEKFGAALAAIEQAQGAWTVARERQGDPPQGSRGAREAQGGSAPDRLPRDAGRCRRRARRPAQGHRPQGAGRRGEDPAERHGVRHHRHGKGRAQGRDPRAAEGWRPGRQHARLARGLDRARRDGDPSGQGQGSRASWSPANFLGKLLGQLGMEQLVLAREIKRLQAAAFNVWVTGSTELFTEDPLTTSSAHDAPVLNAFTNELNTKPMVYLDQLWGAYWLANYAYQLVPLSSPHTPVWLSLRVRNLTPPRLHPVLEERGQGVRHYARRLAGEIRERAQGAAQGRAAQADRVRRVRRPAWSPVPSERLGAGSAQFVIAHEVR